MEDHLALSDEAELITGDALDRRRIVPEVLDLDAEMGDVAPELGVLFLHARQLFFQGAHPREPLGLEDQDGRPHHRQGEGQDGEHTFEPAPCAHEPRRIERLHGPFTVACAA